MESIKKGGASAPSILNQFQIVVFGLESRKDRWERCKEIFNDAGVEKVTRYTTIKDNNDTHRHCAKDFLALLGLKKGSILFFEDDFELCEGWDNVLEKALKDLPQDYDLLYLGGNLTKKPERVTDNLLRVKGAWMFHAVLISDKFRKYILCNYDYNKIWVFDEWCRVNAPKLKFYMTYPMISYQREGYSDFQKKEIYYDIFNNEYYKRV